MFIIPTLKEIINRAAGDMRADLRGSDANLWPNNIAVTVKVIGAAVWNSFSFLSYIRDQIHKSTAEGIFLERHAYDYGLARLGPTYATGRVTLSGDPAIAVPSGLTVQRADGVQYRTTSAGVTDGSGNLTVSVVAVVAGRSGNAVPGVGVSLTSPLSSISSDAVVHADGIGGGANTESDEGLRQRLLARLRFPPHGGAVHDYIAWVREVNSGITRVFIDPVTATNGRDSVGVWFMMDNTYPSGIPQTADVNAVEDFIDTVRPAGAVVEVSAPVAVDVDVVIDELASDSLATREAIRAELAALFRRLPVSTATAPLTLYRSQITEAIAAAVGEAYHILVTPAVDVDFSVGQVPALGDVTFT